MITVTFHCGGCDAVAQGTKPLYKPFHGSQGSWGFGQHRWDAIETVAPEGWLAADPWTAMCYCPTCAKEVMDDTPKSPAPSADEAGK